MISRDEVIKAYGNRVEDKIKYDLSLDYNERSKEALCPFHTEKTPSFKYNDKTFTWHCFGCGENVDIVSHMIEHNNMSYIQAIKTICEEIGIDPQLEDVSQKKRFEQEEYSKPKTKTYPIIEKMVQYAEKRGIKKSTLDYWRVSGADKAFKVNGEFVEKKAFAFNCYDEYNELVNIGFRSGSKDFMQESGCKLIMYGAWHVDFNQPLIITEGQFDAMAIWQSGYKNINSIPAGAQNRKYIEENYDYLSKFPELIFWVDNDEPGRKAGANLKERFPEAIIKIHNECNDPNETLIKLGEAEIRRFLEEKPPLPLGIKGLCDLSYDVEDPTDEERIETGFCDFDKFVKDWRMQQLTVVFGRDNEGKSTVISQIVAHQMKKNMKTFLYSAELGEQGIQEWLYKQIINGEPHSFNKKMGKYSEIFTIKETVLEAIRKYIKDKLYVVDSSDQNIISDNDILFKRMANLSTKFGVKLFILDNLQAILTSKYTDLNRDQSFFMERCRQFAKMYHCHVIVVAHPHKVEELDASDSTLIGNLKKDSISGSKDISNKAHNILSIERNFSDEGDFDMIMTNLKNKVNSTRSGFKYFFNKETFTFYNDSTPIRKTNEWKQFLSDDVDRNTLERIRIKKGSAPWD